MKLKRNLLKLAVLWAYFESINRTTVF